MIESVPIRDYVFKIKRIKNLDDFVDRVSDDEFNIDERLPYWAELWPSAIGLSRYLLKDAPEFNNKSILELGCGLGLTSLCLAMKNPGSLLVSDYEQGALEMTQKNFELNGLALPQMMQIDWRDVKVDQQFDYIVASDVVYEERFFVPLLNLFQSTLDAKGHILLAEPNRAIAKSFFELLANLGYRKSFKNEIVSQDNKPITISIYDIWKP